MYIFTYMYDWQRYGTSVRTGRCIQSRLTNESQEMGLSLDFNASTKFTKLILISHWSGTVVTLMLAEVTHSYRPAAFYPPLEGQLERCNERGHVWGFSPGGSRQRERLHFLFSVTSHAWFPLDQSLSQRVV